MTTVNLHPSQLYIQHVKFNLDAILNLEFADPVFGGHFEEINNLY